MLAAWSIPFPRRECKKKRQQRSKQQGGRRQRVNGLQPAQPPPSQLKAQWDSTTSDHSRYKLSEVEQAFRRSLRQSRHHLRPAAAPASQLEAALADPMWEEQAAMEQLAQDALSAEASWPGASGEESEREDATGESLDGMRQFIANLQFKYGLGSSDSPAAAAATVGGSSAQHKLAQLKAETSVAVTENYGSGSSGCQSEREGEAACSKTAATAAAEPTHQPQGEEGSDSEGEGHFGPAALRRVQQRLAAAQSQLTRNPSAARRQQKGCQMAAAQLSAAQHSLLDRLAAAEAQLDRFAGLEEQLRQTQAAVAELQERNGSLQAELDACISHSLHTTTQLQVQLSRLHASCGNGGGGSEQVEVPCQQPTGSSALPATSVAVVQARAAAEALFVAQQAQLQGHTAVQPAASLSAADESQQEWQEGLSYSLPQNSMQRDALADVQLPSFRRFAELRRVAVSKPRSYPEQKHTAATLSQTPAGAYSSGDLSRQCREGENMPQPRVLPQSLLQQRGAAAEHGCYRWQEQDRASSGTR